MKVVRDLVVSSCIVLAAHVCAAAVTVYPSRGAFDDDVLRSSTDTFDDLAVNQFVLGPLARTAGTFSYDVSARLASDQGNLYAISDASEASNTWLTVDLVESSIVFDHFGAGVDAIAGTFFLTDFGGALGVFSSVTVTAAFASGASTQSVFLTSYRPPTSNMAFLGFVSPGDALISLTVTAVQPSNVALWPTVDNLIVASTSPIPEPVQTWMLALGLCAVAVAPRARRCSSSLHS